MNNYACHHGFASTVPMSHSVMLADTSTATCSLVPVTDSDVSGSDRG